MLNEDVLEVASRYLKKIRRVGSENISATCPFHMKADGSDERSPSFSMSLTKGVWHCWSCHASGTMQAFLQAVGIDRVVVENRYSGLLDALRKNRPSISFDPTRPGVVTEEPLEESMLGLFDKCPVYMVDPEYATYLDPDDPVVFDIDLLRQYDVGFDERHERITFPLRDLDGNLVGISGRTVVGAVPRYKVYDREYSDLGYPVRESTKKGSILWNAHKVYPAAYLGPPDQFVLVVEGFRGCLWAIQSGFRNTVALLGSSLSKQHKWILERMGCRVYLMLDNDEPGQKALRGYVDEQGQKRPGIAEQLKKSLDVSIVQYEGKQPTRLTQEELCAAVNNAVDYYSWAAQQEQSHVIW